MDSTHKQTVLYSSLDPTLPSLGDYLSSLEKKVNLCTDLVTKQSAMIERLLALQAPTRPIEVIEVDEDLTNRHNLMLRLPQA